MTAYQKDNETQDGILSEHAIDACRYVASTAWLLRTPSPSYLDFTAESEQIERELRDLVRCVRGNRPDDGTMTPAECRALYAATMRFYASKLVDELNREF